MRVAPDRLLDFATAVYVRAGMPEADARLAADTLVQADSGATSRTACMRLSWYLARLKAGVCEPVAQPEFVVDAGAVAVMDGKDAMGQVLPPAPRRTRSAGRRRTASARSRCATRTISARRMYFTLMARARGLRRVPVDQRQPGDGAVGRAQEDGRHQSMVAGPRRPGRHPPMVLDIANTGVARGKIYLARQKGIRIPEGWAINADGAPTTDPAEAIAGIILPMAQHKGYAIAVMMDMLSGVLTGSAFGAGVHGPYQTEQPQRRRAAHDRAEHRRLPAAGRVRRRAWSATSPS